MEVLSLLAGSLQSDSHDACAMVTLAHSNDLLVGQYELCGRRHFRDVTSHQQRGLHQHPEEENMCARIDRRTSAHTHIHTDTP